MQEIYELLNERALSHGSQIDIGLVRFLVACNGHGKVIH